MAWQLIGGFLSSYLLLCAVSGKVALTAKRSLDFTAIA